jgi:pSer/pThr/pTyr-binding forkhead associated (FHA) protein
MLGRHDSAEVVLPNKEVSKRHATIYEEQGQWILHDENSTNGTQLNGQICQKSPLKPGDIIQIGPYELMIMIGDPGARPQVGFSHETTLFFSPTTGELLADTPEPETPRPDFPPKIFDRPLVSRGDLERTNLPLQECTYLTIGGGLGSFAWVDHLVIYGADPTRIVVIGNEKDARPYNRYRRLCQNSQIPEHERLRSNSDSCPDNIWGWPGYAVREAWQSFTQGDLQHMLKVLLQIFGEPEVETYTPRSGDVFTAIDREALRIGWPHMWRQGTIEAIRKTDDGRYVVAYSQPDGVGQIHKLHLARYVHLAIGYPAIRILPDLQSYRDQTGDTKSVVNAYERHTHVYNHLAQKGGTVVVRGRGIVASRVIQRLYELRQDHPGRQIQIVHLHRSPTSDGHRYGSARRPVENHWEFQPFNWPKANWGGDLRALLERAIPRDRKELLNDWGGTTTAARPDWRHIVRTGLAEGWYVNRFGSVTDWCRNEQGRLETRIQGNQLEEEIKLVADSNRHRTSSDLPQSRQSRANRDRSPKRENHFFRGTRNRRLSETVLRRHCAPSAHRAQHS